MCPLPNVCVRPWESPKLQGKYFGEDLESNLRPASVDILSVEDPEPVTLCKHYGSTIGSAETLSFLTEKKR